MKSAGTAPANAGDDMAAVANWNEVPPRLVLRLADPRGVDEEASVLRPSLDHDGLRAALRRSS
jgi:hypothetical protein